MQGWRSMIGVISPGRANPIIEEFEMVAPRGVGFITASLDKLPGLSTKVVEEMLGRIEQVARSFSYEQGIAGLMPFSKMDAIIQCGTPLGFIHGVGSDRELIKRIEHITGIPATTHMSALVEALQKLQIKKLVVVAPYYPSELNGKLAKFLTDSGFEVVGITGFADKPEVLATLPYGAYRPAKDFFLKSPSADGLLLCGGAARTFEIIDALEQDIGKPVTSSNHAGIWKLLNMVNVRERIKGYGRLLEMF